MPPEVRRLRVGPIDLLAAAQGRAKRLLDNRLARRFTSTPSDTFVAQPYVTPADLERAATASPEAAAVVEQIRGMSWYHTLELGHGVRTPGFVNHDPQLPHYDLPQSFAGKRVLDVATFDGYWAFEFERRGAEEVVALDLGKKTDLDVPRWMLRDPDGFDLHEPMGTGFAAAHRILGSNVQRLERSVYDLDPEHDGMFDVVFISDLLVHLRDPQLALERAYAVCRGEIILADVYAPLIDGLGDLPVMVHSGPQETWWYPNVACLRRMLAVAGFEEIREVSRFTLAAVESDHIHKVVLRAKPAAEPEWATTLRESYRERRARRAEVTRS